MHRDYHYVDLSYSDIHSHPYTPEKKQMINITLNGVDSNLKRIILRDNPDFPD